MYDPNFFTLNSFKIKNVEFYPDFKFIEGVKNVPCKIYRQICMQILRFSVFTSFLRSLCL
jgi:hypothetical protein